MYIKSMINIVELILKNISKINKDIDQLSLESFINHHF